MQIGIIGLPTVGKTTIFNLLTNASLETAKFFSGRAEANVGMARVPDRRIDFLAKIYKPRKTTYARIQFTEVPGLVRGASEGKGAGNSFLQAVRNVDALIHVVRAFRNPDVLHVDGAIDPLRDIETIDLELLFADLGVLENRIQRIEAGKKKREQEEELAVLRKCKDGLEQGTPINAMALDAGEREWLRNYAFLTEKPMLIVVNVDEDQFRSGDYPGKGSLAALTRERGIPVVAFCGLLEMEVGRLPDEDRVVFLADLGLQETGIERLARATYEHLGLISFLTAGEDEVRAWTIRKGTHAKEAAGKIHSDIERGFIRAEVIAFDDLEESGSMAKAREKGLIRLEGKDYVVRDGDIINFRFNV